MSVQDNLGLAVGEFIDDTNRVDVFVNGGENDEYTADDGSKVPSIRKYLRSIANKFGISTPQSDDAIIVQQPYVGSVIRSQHDKNAEFVSVKDFGAVGDGVTDDTQAFNNALTSNKLIFVPEGLYSVTNLPSLDFKKMYGQGRLVDTAAGDGRYVGNVVFGTSYQILKDTLTDGITPKVNQDGVICLWDVAANKAQMKIWPDGDGDGDYDADLWSDSNMYLSATNAVHLMTSPAGLDSGRVVFAASNDVNFIQSGGNYSKTRFKHLAFSRYGSGIAWGIFNKDSGHFGVGSSFGADPSARLHVADSTATVGVFENNTTSISRIYFKGLGQTDSVGIGCDGDELRLYAGGSNRWRIFSNGTMRPETDNTQNLGTSSTRIGTIYAATGTINTSDERLKTDIKQIDDAVLDAWSDVEWCQYKFIEAVEEKGDLARIHFGVIAQRVLDAFKKHGLDPFAYGVLCYDEWAEERKPIFEQRQVFNSDCTPKTKIVTEFVTATNEAGEALLDRFGKEYLTTVDKDTGEFIYEEVKTCEDIKPAGNRYGVRYELAFALESALMRRKIKRIENLIELLERK